MQEYFVYAVDQNGNIPTLNGFSVEACFVVGEIMELLSLGCVVQDENRQLVIGKSFDSSLTYLRQMCNLIARYKNPVDIISIAEDSYLDYGRTIINLLTPIGESLLEVGSAVKLHDRGLINRKAIYAPTSDAVTYVIEKNRAAFFEDGKMNGNSLYLAALLDKSDLILKYFNKTETSAIQKLIKDARVGNEDESIRDILDCVDCVSKVASALALNVL
jgi:hypothetical protein